MEHEHVPGPRTVGELVQALLALPQDTPVYTDPEGDPIPLGPVATREVVRTPSGRPEYLTSWESLRDVCLNCGVRHCTREGHRLRRDTPVEPVLVAVLEGGEATW